MTATTIGIAVVTVVYFIIRYLNRTDIPKIKNLPEIPGLPLFGNLLQLGDQHATVAGKWAKKYGPVFQVRMGNKVPPSIHPTSYVKRYGANKLAHHLRQLLRLRPPTLDQRPIRPRLAANLPHLSQRRLQLPGLYHRYIPLG